jgi:hypothetical protein
MVRDTLPLIEGSTDSDSLSDTATANDDDEESTFQTQDETSLEVFSLWTSNFFCLLFLSVMTDCNLIFGSGKR